MPKLALDCSHMTPLAMPTNLNIINRLPLKLLVRFGVQPRFEVDPFALWRRIAFASLCVLMCTSRCRNSAEGSLQSVTCVRDCSHLARRPANSALPGHEATTDTQLKLGARQRCQWRQGGRSLACSLATRLQASVAPMVACERKMLAVVALGCPSVLFIGLMGCAQARYV